MTQSRRKTSTQPLSSDDETSDLTSDEEDKQAVEIAEQFENFKTTVINQSQSLT